MDGCTAHCHTLVAEDSNRKDQEREAAMLLSVAEVHIENAELVEALQAASEAVNLFRRAANTILLTDALRMLVAAHRQRAEMNLKAPDEALSIAGKEIFRCREEDDMRGEAVMGLAIVECNITLLKDNTELIAESERALATLQKSGETSLQAYACLVLVKSLLRDEGDTVSKKKVGRRALMAAKHALTMYRSVGDRAGEVQAFQCMALARFASESFKEGLVFAKQALSIAHTLGLKKSAAVLLEMIAQKHILKGAPLCEDALPFAEQAFSIFEVICPNTGWEATALSLVVQAHRARGQIQQAFYLVNEGLSRYGACHNRRAEVVMLDLKLCACVDDQDWDMGLQILNEMLAICDEQGELESKMNLLHLAARLHWFNNDLAEAAFLASQSTRLAMDLRHDDAEAAGRQLLTDFYIEAGEHYLVIEEALKAKVASERSGRWNDAGNCLINVGAATHKLGDSRRAISIALEALGLFEAHSLARGQACSLQLMYTVYTDIGRHHDALHSITQAIKIGKSVGGEKILLVDLLISGACAHMNILRSEFLNASKQDQDAMYKHGFREVWEKAFLYASEACLVSTQHVHRVLEASAHYTLAQVLFLGGRGDDALKESEVARMLFRDVRHRDEAEALLLSSRAQNLAGRPDKALVLVTEALRMFRQDGNPIGEKSALGVLENIAPKEQAEFAFRSTVAATSSSDWQQAKPKIAVDPTAIAKTVMLAAREIVSEGDELAMDDPLMEAGMDSLAVVSFRNKLLRIIPGVPMSATLVFEFPTVRTLSEHFVEALSG